MPNYKPIQPKTRQDSEGQWYAYFEGECENPRSQIDEKTALNALYNRTIKDFRCEKVSRHIDAEKEVECLNKTIDKMRWCLNWEAPKRLSNGYL